VSASAFQPQQKSPNEALAWRRGPLRPRISPGEVHVWRAQLARLADRSGLLSEAEHERERQIVSERDRQLWARSHSVLRVLLSRYLDVDPQQVTLAIEPNGKPYLRRPGEDQGARPPAQARREPHETQALHFNMSHSGELALYAFSSSWPVGVDVELAHVEGRRRDHVALARRVFGEGEARRLQGLSPAAREREFLRLWTRHEAALKRVGRGIGAGGADASGVDASGVEESAWIVELDLGAGAAAALAGERRVSALQAWSLS
jgi:4'-phosphopantetheinyl transferase